MPYFLGIQLSKLGCGCVGGLVPARIAIHVPLELHRTPPHAFGWHGSIGHSESRVRASGPDPSEWVLRFDACDSTDRDPNQHAIQSIRLWIPRSVALHKIQIKILLLWICPRHFAVCVGKALGIRIRLKCGVSAQPKMMIFKMFQTCSQLVALEFRPPANFFPGGSLQCPAASETAVFPAGLQEGQQVFAAHESGECVGWSVFPEVARQPGFLLLIQAELHVCALELGRWCRMLLQGCCCKVLVLKCFSRGCGAHAAVRMLFRFGIWLLVPLQGAAARCCQSAVCALEFSCWCRCAAGCLCKVLVLECCLSFGAWFLVPTGVSAVALQGAAITSLVCALELGCWCCRVPLQGACVGVLFWLWSLAAGAAVGCCFQRAVCTLGLPVAGAAVRVLCVCALWTALCGRCRVPLQGACVGVLCALSKPFKHCLQRLLFTIWDLCWRNFLLRTELSLLMLINSHTDFVLILQGYMSCNGGSRLTSQDLGSSCVCAVDCRMAPPLPHVG